MINREVGRTEQLEGGPFGARTMVLSIVMPTYNEGRTLATAIDQVLDVTYPCPIELIVVNDGSNDDTTAILAEVRDPRVVIHHHATNLGKGAAILSGIARAKGTHVVPFDADLEYSAKDLPALVEPVLSGRAEIVYGPRLFGTNTVYHSYRYAMGNKLTTFIANILFDAYISDLHTCMKLVPVTLVRGLSLREEGFAFDSELTAELLSLGYRPFEVPITYHARTRSEGKKLNWRDGLFCMAVLVRIRSRSNRVQRKQAHWSSHSGEGGWATTTPADRLPPPPVEPSPLSTLPTEGAHVVLAPLEGQADDSGTSEYTIATMAVASNGNSGLSPASRAESALAANSSEGGTGDPVTIDAVTTPAFTRVVDSVPNFTAVLDEETRAQSTPDKVQTRPRTGSVPVSPSDPNNNGHKHPAPLT